MTNRETAEMIAKFRTPPGFSWQDLANDIETALDMRSNKPTAEIEPRLKTTYRMMRVYNAHWVR
jgi:hypothetical protein